MSIYVCVETAITINYAKPFGQCSCKLPGKSLSAGVSKLYVLFRMVGSPEIYRGDYSDMELNLRIDRPLLNFHNFKFVLPLTILLKYCSTIFIWICKPNHFRSHLIKITIIFSSSLDTLYGINVI